MIPLSFLDFLNDIKVTMAFGAAFIIFGILLNFGIRRSSLSSKAWLFFFPAILVLTFIMLQEFLVEYGTFTPFKMMIVLLNFTVITLFFAGLLTHYFEISKNQKSNK